MSLRDRLLDLRQRLIGHEVSILRQEHRQAMHLVRVSLGSLAAREIAATASECNDAEFTAFSQFGEDGIIEYLIRHCDISPQIFVEIGVETYAEANTRFLAEHRLWRGLIVDQNPQLDEDLAATQLHWRSQVNSMSSFVTRENAQQLVAPFVGSGGLGLLSLDIDGVDYWILEQLVSLDAALIIVEYNALFGDTATVTIPYEGTFDRGQPSYHNIYYGASLAAFDHLLAPRGYALVACTTAGNNAFFVRSDRLGDVAARSVTDAYRPRRFVEHRAADGTLTGIADRHRQLQDIQRLPLVDVTDGSRLTVAEILT